MEYTSTMQPSAPKIVYCTRCGKPACGHFCANCGEPLRMEMPVTPIPAPEPMPQPIEEPQTDDTPKKKKNTGLIVLCILTGVAVAALLTVVLIYFTFRHLAPLDILEPIETEIYRGGVNAEEYEKLKPGMTYAHVSAIIGGDGVLLDNGLDEEDDIYYIYGWPLENDDTSAVYVTFVNNAVTEIELDGTL